MTWWQCPLCDYYASTRNSRTNQEKHSAQLGVLKVCSFNIGANPSFSSLLHTSDRLAFIQRFSGLIFIALWIRHSSQRHKTYCSLYDKHQSCIQLFGPILFCQVQICDESRPDNYCTSVNYGPPCIVDIVRLLRCYKWS